MKQMIVTILCGCFFIMGCKDDREQIIYVSYVADTASLRVPTNSFVCYTRSQLDEALEKFPIPDKIAAKLKGQEFGDVLVCGIRNYEIFETGGRGGVGFIRVRSALTNGMCVAIITRKMNRFYQFNETLKK